MSSGVAVDPSCIESFNGLKKRDVRAVVMKINDGMTKIEVEKTMPTGSGDVGTAEAEWKECIDSLPENDCRFLLYDFLYEHQGLPKSKIVFLKWAPETAKIKSKTIYASSQEGCLNQMEGVGRQLQATDEDESARWLVRSCSDRILVICGSWSWNATDLSRV
ncbi:Cofilin [Porphyridium purpureum]|uniref:Cofilin n=1 Tax=Porphyridium purpureum TaxID=35688 RepID=A0A5J4YTF8_PORPP|nr:Cofilin [Porphyridium purpureum]|eukprot:POR6755..scf229_5